MVKPICSCRRSGVDADEPVIKGIMNIHLYWRSDAKNTMILVKTLVIIVGQTEST